MIINENECSECHKEMYPLYKNKDDGKKYCIHCFGKIRLEREKRYKISRYEKRKSKNNKI